ncbi:MAG: hypothetical protein WC869_07745 [Phycisphaerae bacterium]
MKSWSLRHIGLLCLAGICLPLCGCAGSNTPSLTPVPSPINLMLPQSLRIHPFTALRDLEDANGVRGLDVRIEALDAYGDTTRAYGDFRFELYTFRNVSTDPKDVKIAAWDVPMLEAKANLSHWNNITRAYEFKLQWTQPAKPGQKFVLVATFSSPFNQRIFAEYVVVAGQ